MSSVNKIKIKQVKSSIGSLPNHKLNLKGLGLKRIGHSVEREDTPAIRGMIKKVIHLVELEGVKI